jgi:7-keto-8-aminopelargonate synthetase-like enzyme
MTEPEPLQSVDRTCVRYRRRKLISFSGCDYFRLSSHPAVVKSARDGLYQFGLNVAASRLTTGNHEIYGRLEKQLARFFDAENALLIPSGYLTSLAVAQALAGNCSHALLDERAHPALADAAQLLDCPVLRFKHRDAGDLERTIARCGRGARLVVLTDGMFSHDGSIAPLKSYLSCLGADGLLLVDDAHGAGVLGRRGRGTIEVEGVSRQRIIQCITLSKAFGAFGGAVLGTRELRNRILERSRIFVGCTPIPLPLACAASMALTILREDKRLRQRLTQNANYVKSALRQAGFELPDAPGPIIPIHFRNERENASLKRRLLTAGIYPPFLNYPGGPANGYFRFVISSEHNRRQLDCLLNVLAGNRQPVISDHKMSDFPSGGS